MPGIHNRINSALDGLGADTNVRKITRKIWSHESVDSGQKHFLAEVRTSKPKIVHSFHSLLEAVALVSYHNPDLSLFYRGQPREYLAGQVGTSIYPCIYRISARSTRGARRKLKTRYEELSKVEGLLKMEFRKSIIEGHGKVEQFREISWAIIQHYEISPTPLLDLTTSLRVACSFALDGINKYGIVCVLGLPHPNGSISYYVEEQLRNIRLLSICPPEALRPYYQEGFLAGTFPDRDPPTLSSQHDFARRLVAKFKIPKAEFWSNEFPPIPRVALYPANDRIEGICNGAKAKLEAASN